MADLKLVDLRKDFSAKILHDFYIDCVVPCFGMFKDVMEDEEEWRRRLTTPEDECRFIFHIVVGIDRESDKVLGGLAFEYYKESNCGLYTYAAASPESRGKGLAKLFVDEVFNTVNADARKYHGTDCRAIFIECNSPLKVSAEDDSMIPLERIRMFSKMGYRFLDFPYVQPALAQDKGKCHDLVVGVHSHFLMVNPEAKVAGLKDSAYPDVAKVVPSKILLDWITDVFVSFAGPESLVEDADYIKIKEYLSERSFVRVAPSLHPPQASL